MQASRLDAIATLPHAPRALPHEKDKQIPRWHMSPGSMKKEEDCLISSVIRLLLINKDDPFQNALCWPLSTEDAYMIVTVH